MGIKKKEKNKIVVGFDLATKLGYSKFEIQKDKIILIDSGVWEFKPCDDFGGGWRFVQCERELIKFLDGVDFVGYELVQFIPKGFKAAFSWGGFRNLLGKVCSKSFIPYNGYHTGTVKRQFTGMGNAKKNLMKKTANKMYGIKVKDDNEADAIAVGYTLIKDLGWVNGFEKNTI